MNLLTYSRDLFARNFIMRTTLALDDELLAKAPVSKRNPRLYAKRSTLIERESARRLARLGGTEPKAKAAPRGSCS
jgi:hypothetical protein